MLDPKLCNWEREPGGPRCVSTRAHGGDHDYGAKVPADPVLKGLKELAEHIINERALFYKETGELRDFMRALSRRVEALEARVPPASKV